MLINSVLFTPFIKDKYDIAQEFLRNAIQHYYLHNTQPGCFDPSAKNFNFQANVDNGVCDNASFVTTFPFAGYYQKCTVQDNSDARITADKTICTGINMTNPKTGINCCMIFITLFYFLSLYAIMNVFRRNVMPTRL